MILLICSTTLVSIMPFTFSGLGVKENVFVYLAIKMGIDPAPATAVIFTSTIVSWAVLVLFVGMLYEEAKALMQQAKEESGNWSASIALPKK